MGNPRRIVSACIVVASLWVVLFEPTIAAADASDRPPVPTVNAAPAASKCIPESDCCRICDQGKACGDSCIAKRFTCHKGRGCSCNATELCTE